jgi:hypothetical protein
MNSTGARSIVIIDINIRSLSDSIYQPAPLWISFFDKLLA